MGTFRRCGGAHTVGPLQYRVTEVVYAMGTTEPMSAPAKLERDLSVEREVEGERDPKIQKR